MTVTGASNPKVKELLSLCRSAKERKERGCYLAEGSKMAAEAPLSLVREVVVSESFAKDGAHEALLGRFSREPFILSDSLFERVSDAKTPQGILLVIKQRIFSFSDLWTEKGADAAAPLLLILEDVRDPGNVGTIFRTAEAAGAGGILLSLGCADVTNPKAVRAAMGSLFRMPYYITDDLVSSMQKLREKGVRLYAAHPRADRAYDAMDYTLGCAFLIGNEAGGLSQSCTDAADERITIPMAGEAESLNAAVSAALLVYEAARQRRRHL